MQIECFVYMSNLEGNSSSVERKEEVQTTTTTNGVIDQPSKFKMNGVVGNMEIFNFDEDNFSEYLERFQYIFTVNGIVDEKLKTALVMSMAGKEFHSKVTSLIMPKKPSDYKYDELMEELKKHFSPKTNIRYERYKFMSRQFGDHETLTDFIVDLKFLADSCGYGDFLDSALSDKLIWSLRDSGMQRKLLDEPISKSFSEICTIALTMEMVSKNVDEMQGHRKQLEGETRRVNKTFNKYARGAQPSGSREYKNLKVSRNADHDNKPEYSGRRRFSEEKEKVQCYKCQGFGHISRDCNSRRKPYYRSRNGERSSYQYTSSRSRNMNHVDEEGRRDKDDSSEGGSEEPRNDYLRMSTESLDEDAVYMNNLRLGRKDKGKNCFKTPLILKVEVDDVVMAMEIDSGASFSVISNKYFKKYFEGKRLLPCSIPLGVISGSNLKILGRFEVEVFGFDNSPICLSLIVIETQARFLPLLGRDWMDELFPDWKNAFKVNLISNPMNLDYLKTKFPNVFDGDYTGTIKGHVAHIVMAENVSPIFCGAYTVHTV